MILQGHEGTDGCWDSRSAEALSKDKLRQLVTQNLDVAMPNGDVDVVTGHLELSDMLALFGSELMVAPQALQHISGDSWSTTIAMGTRSLDQRNGGCGIL